MELTNYVIISHHLLIEALVQVLVIGFPQRLEVLHVQSLMSILHLHQTLTVVILFHHVAESLDVVDQTEVFLLTKWRWYISVSYKISVN